MVVPFANFYGIIWVGFCLSTEKCFILEVSFQRQEKEHGLLYKNSSRDFQNSPLFERFGIFLHDNLWKF